VHSYLSPFLCMWMINVQPSLPIFWCSSRTPDHLTHASQSKDSFPVQGFEHFRSDFTTTYSLWCTSTIEMVFSSPNVPRVCSAGVIVTGFKRSLKYSLQLSRMSFSFLSKTPFSSLMDLSLWNLFQRRSRMVCLNILVAFQ